MQYVVLLVGYFYANRKRLAKRGVDVNEWSRETDWSTLPEKKAFRQGFMRLGIGHQKKLEKAMRPKLNVGTPVKPAATAGQHALRKAKLLKVAFIRGFNGS